MEEKTSIKTIAVLMTCHNREKLTESCLQHLLAAQKSYDSSSSPLKLDLQLFLLDDSCSDGTVDSVYRIWGKHNLRLIKGDGNCYWAGGMYKIWSYALSTKQSFDYYLLLNDDTDVLDDCFEELFKTETFCIENYGMCGIYSGATCAKNDYNQQTYGGAIYHSKFFGHPQDVFSNGNPQLIDITNANILLVPSSIVDQIGIFYKGFIHSAADSDYAMRARKNGIPVLITGRPCGGCDNDHFNDSSLKDKILSMNVKQRRDFFNHPLHSKKDYLIFLKRNMPMKCPFAWLFWQLNIYMPSLYYKINGIR